MIQLMHLHYFEYKLKLIKFLGYNMHAIGILLEGLYIDLLIWLGDWFVNLFIFNCLYLLILSA